MNFLIAGASGFIGSALIQSLKERGSVKSLGRRISGADQFRWDPQNGEVEKGAFQEVDVVINLAGENVASGIWTKGKMARIKESRVGATRLIVETIATLKERPNILINASAVGFYGNRGDEELTEESVLGGGYFPDVCLAWENEALKAESLGLRVVLLRFGIVLDRNGGALPKMALPFRFCLGGLIGNGKQYISWITLRDTIAAILFILEKKELSGAINIVSPHAVTNRELTTQLAKALHRPAIIPLPAFAARIMFGRMADEMLLSSTRALPSKLLLYGFEFRDAEIKKALGY